MKVFDPFRMYLSPLRTAVVVSAAASEPQPGSVSPMQPIHSPVASFGRYFSFCASVPCCRMLAAQR